MKLCLGPKVALGAQSVSSLFAIFDFSRRSMTGLRRPSRATGLVLTKPDSSLSASRAVL
jgi:hypothetical protein